ncbi:hypothetical protein [Rhizobium sp. RM]|uniref:hypothetical protein n=1 Tax=Rhizobium sp. RM TaxID=2748079 RepID=UPI00110D2C69|nr:hypothetical protein [Rhizobium sp. RM]NWJ27613.1 hypothetical protein [Rhizobium sp. RM]TMV19937.1 hypothetical protein BJG94_11035 [Rhizobium sp. Td3]
MGERSENETPMGATMDLPHDRITVERFREAFPRARWSETRKAWFVPGRTAQRRIGRWLAQIEAEADAFAHDKGRDAFAFDPIESRYLEAGTAALLIRTPYSKTLVSEIREIRDARWDADRLVWAVPYRSYEDLRSRWSMIEAIAARSEPTARKQRRDAIRGTDEEEVAKARIRERRRKRYPVPSNQLPPFDRAISTAVGIVVFTALDGELADAETVESFYFPVTAGCDYLWVSWRAGILEELATTWPAKSGPPAEDRLRGWWLPTLEELRTARREARSREKSRQRRLEGKFTA